MKRSLELNTKTLKVQKKYDTFYGVVIKIGFQVNRRQRGTIKKKGSIKACEFNCCIKKTDNMSVYVQTFLIRLKAALLMIDRKNENFKFSKINIMRV